MDDDNDLVSSRFESNTTAAWSVSSTSVERCRRGDEVTCDVTDNVIVFSCLRATVDNTRRCTRTPVDVRSPDDIFFHAWENRRCDSKQNDDRGKYYVVFTTRRLYLIRDIVVDSCRSK